MTRKQWMPTISVKELVGLERNQETKGLIGITRDDEEVDLSKVHVAGLSITRDKKPIMLTTQRELIQEVYFRPGNPFQGTIEELRDCLKHLRGE